jgi:hypothetical protein
MKNILKAAAMFLVSGSLLITGCKKSAIDENYYNPEASVTANISALYAGLFNNDRVIPRYWNLYTFLIPVMGTYSQTIGYSNGQKIYEQPVNYTQDKWNSFYTGTMSQYREIEKYYNNLPSDADKAGYLVFLETSRIFVYDQAAQMVDLWGDIPFSKAGQLNTTGTLSLATFDKGKDVYTFILADLKRISDYLAGQSVDPFYTTQLAKYDYVNGGNITLWRKYCNSLRLRLAMRTSYADEAASKAIVQEILTNATKYPLIDAVADNIQIKVSGTLVSTGNDIRNGFGVNPFASAYMVDSVMAPANDPRLPVLYTTNYRGEYHGVPNTWNAARVTDSTTKGYFSRYDSVTFTENNLFPGIIMTAAEVSLLKAEAYERWAGGSAKTAYEDAIDKSTQYYYSINNQSNYGVKDVMPTAAAMAAYKARAGVAYTGNSATNLQLIAKQKMIDFNVIMGVQAWSEYRRTKMPALVFPTDNSSALSPNVPTRLLYPSTEKILNSANYQGVAAADNVTSKVFWDVK